MKTITIKKNSKMKTIKLNKNGKARQPRKLTKKQVEACGWQCKTKRDAKADQITKILAHVSNICDYVKDNLCSEQCQFEELEEMLWKLAR